MELIYQACRKMCDVYSEKLHNQNYMESYTNHGRQLNHVFAPTDRHLLEDFLMLVLIG